MIDSVCAGESTWPLTILGGVGVGKTCAALCLLDQCKGGRRYFTTMGLVSRLNGYRRESAGSLESVFWDEWRKAMLVVLDEIGAREQVSDSHYESVKLAIDYRNEEPAIYISNLTIAELTALYDDRIASRLQAGTVLDMFGWPDRRVKESTHA